MWSYLDLDTHKDRMFAYHMENPGLILSTGNAMLFLITYFIVLMLPTGMPIHNSGANKARRAYCILVLKSLMALSHLVDPGNRYGTHDEKSVLITIKIIQFWEVIFIRMMILYVSNFLKCTLLIDTWKRMLFLFLAFQFLKNIKY